MDAQNVVTTKQKVGKIISYVLNVLSIIIMLFAVFIVITSLSSKDRGYTVYFGKAFVTVSSDSMEAPEGQEAKWDNFNEGDVIVFNVLSESAKENLEVGTVITFWDYNIGTQKELNTHRIVAKEVQNGIMCYQTKGDNNPIADATWRKSTDVQGTYAGKSVVFGQALTYLQSKTGFAVFIVLPCVLIMIYCAVLVILNLMRYSKEKAVLQHEDDVDALKAQLKEQILKEMAEKEGAGKDAGEEEKKKEEEEKPEPENVPEVAEEEPKEEVVAEAVEEQPKQDEVKADEE